jgi:hypothetical protein
MIALFERRDIAERGWRQEEFDSKVTTWVSTSASGRIIYTGLVASSSTKGEPADASELIFRFAL